MAKEITEKNVKKFLKSFDQKPTTVEVVVGDAKLDITVKHLVGTDILDAMVNLVVDSAIHDGVYNPAIVEPAKWAAILCHVANFTDELSDEQFNQLCYCSKIRAAVLKNWNMSQFQDFDIAVSNKIRHEQEEMISAQKIRLEAIANQLEITTTYMKNITEAFKNVDPEMIAGVIQKLSGMDEMVLGNAVIDIRDLQAKQDVVE